MKWKLSTQKSKQRKLRCLVPCLDTYITDTLGAVYPNLIHVLHDLVVEGAVSCCHWERNGWMDRNGSYFWWEQWWRLLSRRVDRLTLTNDTWTREQEVMEKEKGISQFRNDVSNIRYQIRVWKDILWTPPYVNDYLINKIHQKIEDKGNSDDRRE